MNMHLGNTNVIYVVIHGTNEMERNALEFSHTARVVYTASKSLFAKRTKFADVKYDDDLYIIEARRGSWLSPFSENIKIKVVATSTESCKVILESTSRSALNLLNFGANSTNISDLSDFINNEVYKLLNVGDIKITKPNIIIKNQKS